VSSLVVVDDLSDGGKMAAFETCIDVVSLTLSLDGVQLTRLRYIGL